MEAVLPNAIIKAAASKQILSVAGECIVHNPKSKKRRKRVLLFWSGTLPQAKKEGGTDMNTVKKPYAGSS